VSERLTVEALLERARARLRRMSPAEAHGAMGEGALLIDIRSESQRGREGGVPGALAIPRNQLEWRLDPDCAHRHPDAPALDDQVIVMCDEGYQSSLAAATLQELGFARATDLEGGFQAWRRAGLPVVADARGRRAVRALRVTRSRARRGRGG